MSQNNKIKFAARCPCGAEIILEEEFYILAIYARKQFEQWQRTHQHCVPILVYREKLADQAVQRLMKEQL